MGNKNNCVICGGEIIYSNDSKLLECCYCKKEELSNAMCEKGHYICDHCHSSGAYEIIKRYCSINNEKNPFKMAIDLMMHPSVKMHGPEHHFLVPAVLLTAYYNTLNQHEEVMQKLEEAAKRAKNVLGGFCGFYGSCGAGIGTGIFISIITGANPLSINEWRLCNLMTSKSLQTIAENGGPRCCKRDSFLAIEEAINFVRDNFDVSMESEMNVKCKFSSYNSQCLKNNCKYNR